MVPSTAYVSQRRGNASVKRALQGDSVTGAFLQPTIFPTVKVMLEMENPPFNSYLPPFLLWDSPGHSALWNFVETCWSVGREGPIGSHKVCTLDEFIHHSLCYSKKISLSCRLMLYFSK